MKKKTALMTSVVALSALLLAGCPAKQEEKLYVTGPYLTGKEAKRTYNAYLGSAPSTLDARKSQNAENVSHLANFEDCLVMNDGYGILKKSLAKTAERNNDATEFKFTIKENIPWVTCDGQQYEYKNKKQYVDAEDFVTTAREILNYDNESEITYMYTLFVKNAWELYCYTKMANYMANRKKINGVDYGDLYDHGTDDEKAAALTNLIIDDSGHEPDQAITGADLDAIASYERLGVQVVNEGGKKVLVYTLNQPADFFPTMLTYTPFTPINKHFLGQHRTDYGTKRDTILYCGPFLLKTYSGEKIQYVKNNQYWNKDYVHIETVNYTTVDASLGYEEQRKAFDDGRVDGFALSMEDEKGWDMYITGASEGKHGDIEHPVSDVVNSRELDDVDFTTHFVLDPNRPTTKDSYEHSDFYNSTFAGAAGKGKATDEEKVADIENTNRALSLQAVRSLVLNGIDLKEYNKHYNTPAEDQYQMNTFTPRGYVYDSSNNNKDYVDYYYEYYADQKGIEGEDRVEAGKEAVGPQQLSGVNYTDDAETVAKYPWTSMTGLRESAVKAVQLYNADESKQDIKLPVNIEYLGIQTLAPKQKTHEDNTVRLWNERANGCTLSDSRVSDTLPRCMNPDGTTKASEYPYFKMSVSAAPDESTFDSAAHKGYYSIYTGWGWIGDYADPLTYVHCYVTNGEMSKMSGNNDKDYMSYRLNEDQTALIEEKMYESYNANVDAANAEHNSTTLRYQLFAQCEYQLLNDVYIIKPTAMSSQGWVASVSRAAGYENPTAHYGLAENILAGMWVLVDVPTGKEREKARDDRKAREVEELAKYGNNAINGIYVDD